MQSSVGAGEKELYPRESWKLFRQARERSDAGPRIDRAKELGGTTGEKGACGEHEQTEAFDGIVNRVGLF